MNKMLFVLVLLSSLLLSCSGTASTSVDTPLDTAQDSFDHLFLAFDVPDGSGLIQLDFYNIADEGVVSDSYTITPPDPRAGSRFENGNNDEVQYDPGTGLVFFATSGTAEMDGRCANADGTCGDRLYQWKVGDTEPSIFWDSEGSINDWLVDPQTHTVWVNALTEVFGTDADGKTAPLLIQLNLANGKVLSHQPLSSGGALRLSSDGKRITQLTGIDRVAGRIGFASVPTSGEALISTLELGFQTNGGTHPEIYHSGLAPDAQHFVYFLNYSSGEIDSPLVTTLYLSPMKMDSMGKVVEFDGAVNNYNIYWSADSTHFAVQAKDGLWIYDVNGSLVTKIGEAGESGVLWNPSIRYLLTASSETFKLRDLDQDTGIDIPFPFTGWPLGATFY